MAKRLTSFKVAASTLIEVIIAMVMIIVIFGVAMMIYGNVMRSSVNIVNIQAEKMMNDELIHSETTGTDTDSTYTKDSISIERRFTPFRNNIAVHKLTVIAYNANHDTIGVAQKILLR